MPHTKFEGRRPRPSDTEKTIVNPEDRTGVALGARAFRITVPRIA